jgi:hypothetical protein
MLLILIGFLFRVTDICLEANRFIGFRTEVIYMACLIVRPRYLAFSNDLSGWP